MRYLLKMLRFSNNNGHPTDGDEATAEADEPPDDRKDPSKQHNYYMKEKLTLLDAKKESLLTRALLSSPDPSPIERSDPLDGWKPKEIVPILSRGNSNTSTSGDDTALNPSQSRSIARPAEYPLVPSTESRPKAADPRESEVEANLGRKRCITFACARKLSVDDQTGALSDTVKEVTEPPITKRKSALTFVCPAPNRTPTSRGGDIAHQQPSRRLSLPPPGRRSPAPHMRKPKWEPEPIAHPVPFSQQPKEIRTSKITVTGLGEFKLSDATRFHEFGSSLDDDEDWVNESTDDKPKITMSDCMKKENAIRKLGEEVEDEVRQAEEEENEEYDEDNDDDDQEEDNDENDEDDDDNDEDGDGVDDGDSTVHDGLSDDGNESDNEAGFASGDDSDENSDFNFWTPGMATAATSVDHAGSVQHSTGRKTSDSSIESGGIDKDATPLATRRKSTGRPIKLHKHRPATPDLPDSTDFVCGTLDEDRPLEAAYKSCMEERRLSKRVPIPQDIDPSFPTSDPEDDDNDDDLEVEAPPSRRSRIKESLDMFELRGRKKEPNSKTTPNHSPKSRPSPPPHKPSSRCSPRRLRSPAPPVRRKSPAPSRRPSLRIAPPSRPAINITGLAQRGPRVRTKSLPRTPNPFFARLESRRQTKAKPLADRSHTRGPVDIVAGLEKKRQKRKEKFWRQHCRKAAKEQLERRPLPGKGAERMKELGLEVAERFRAYGFGQDTQLVLSI